MSVESARNAEYEALCDLIDVVVDQGTESSRRFKEAWNQRQTALDRLILEVRAEDGCWREWALGADCAKAECTPCPSCTARAQLAEKVPT